MHNLLKKEVVEEVPLSQPASARGNADVALGSAHRDRTILSANKAASETLDKKATDTLDAVKDAAVEEHLSVLLEEVSHLLVEALVEI